MRWLWLTLAGCGSVRSGTAVGNPGDLDTKASRSDVDVALESVSVEAEALSLDGCGWPGVEIAAGVVLDGVLPSASPIGVPGGTWCGLVLQLASPVVVTGSTTAGTTFSLELDLPEIASSGRFRIDGEVLLLELPLPLSSVSLDALGPTVVLGVDDPLAIQIAAAARDGASLWSDDDADGLLSAPDRRVLAPFAFETGLPSAAMAPDSASCGCAHGGSTGGALVWLVVVRYGRRRARVAGRRALRQASGASGVRREGRQELPPRQVTVG